VKVLPHSGHLSSVFGVRAPLNQDATGAPGQAPLEIARPRGRGRPRSYYAVRSKLGSSELASCV
jgi:hypothetical protein